MSNYLFCNLFFLLLLLNIIQTSSSSYFASSPSSKKYSHNHITSRLVCPLFNEIKKDTQEDPKKTTKTQLSTFFEYDECVCTYAVIKKTNKKTGLIPLSL